MTTRHSESWFVFRAPLHSLRHLSTTVFTLSLPTSSSFFCANTKLATLIRVYLWWFCHCCNSTPIRTKEKEVAPTIRSFLPMSQQHLSFSNAELNHHVKGFAAAGTAVNDTSSVTATASAWDGLLPNQYPQVCNH